MSRAAAPVDHPSRIRARTAECGRATAQSATGLAIGLATLATVPVLLLIAAGCLILVGLPLVRPAVHWLRTVAGWERRRLRWMGHDVPDPYVGAPESGPLDVLRDPTVRRDLTWLVAQSTFGIVVTGIGVQIPVLAVREISFPGWWWLLPPSGATAANGAVPISTWGGAFATAATGPLWGALWFALAPRMAALSALPGRRLLTPHPDIDLTARVAELTATRAAALDAHAVELRRIERALHDGAQNRLVGVAMLVGAARRTMTTDPDRTGEILARAHDAAEAALAELRAVVRSILPPVLEDRGLSGALAALASQCPVDCRLDVAITTRCPASVEATAYFTVAEALTNVAKHSRARHVRVRVRRHDDRLIVTVTDDGRGGADPATGSGLAGIADRVAAHDGTTTVTSPAGGPTVVEVELPCGS